MGFFSSVRTVLFCSAIGYVVTFVTQALIAERFGTSAVVDAFSVASIIPLFLFGIANALLMTPLVVIFTERALDNEKAALDFVNGLLQQALLILPLFAIGTYLSAPLIAAVLAPGFSIEQRVILEQFVRLIAPSIFFLGLTSLATGVLYAKKSFAIPSLQRAVLGMGTLVVLLLPIKSMSLPLGFVFGSFLLVLLSGLGVYAKGWRYKQAILDVSLRKELVQLAIPLMGVSLLYYVNKVVINMFASQLGEGFVAAFNFAFALVMLPTILLSESIATSLYPSLAQYAAEYNMKKFKDEVNVGLSLMIAVMIPVSVALMVVAEPLVALVYNRGMFDAVSVKHTASAFVGLSAGMVFLGLDALWTYILLALKRSQDRLWMMATTVVATAVCSSLLASLGVGGVALGYSLAYGISGILGAVLVHNALPGIFSLDIIKECLKVGLAVLTTVVILVVGYQWVALPASIFGLGSHVVGGLVLYSGIALMYKVHGLTILTEWAL